MLINDIMIARRVNQNTGISFAKANDPTRGQTNMINDCSDHNTPTASPIFVFSVFLTISLLYPTCISDQKGIIENHPRINIHHIGATSMIIVPGIIPRLMIFRS